MAESDKPAGSGAPQVVGSMVGGAGGWTEGQTITTEDARRFWGVQTFLKSQIAQLVENPTVGFLGIPFDGGNFRTAGTRFGPRGVRTASQRMGNWSEQFECDPHAKHRMADFGDVIMSPFSMEEAYEAIENAATRIYEAGAMPICIGGDHSVTLPLIRAAAKQHGPVSIVHFDAHCDVSDTAFGQPYHFGSMFRRAYEEDIVTPANVFQIGPRKFYHPGELEFARGNYTVITSRDLKMMGTGMRDTLRAKLAPLKGTKIYCSFDIDFIDQADAPGVGSAEPFGPNSFEALECLRAMDEIAGDIVGMDLVEVAPPFDIRDQTSYLATLILHEFVAMKPGTI